MDMQRLNEINDAYYRLEQKQAEIVRALCLSSFELESGWYSGHYHREGNGNWFRESYPIPVIAVKGLCDIEVQFDGVSVSSKLERETALAYSFAKLVGVPFEAFGVKDYLADLYHPGLTEQELKENIRTCDEGQIAFSFAFLFDVEGRQILEFVELLRREGFFY